MSLGCGGLWDQAMISAQLDDVTELRGKLTALPQTPERDQAEATLSAFEREAARGNITFGEGIMFSISFDEAVQDGTIDSVDITQLQRVFLEVKNP